MENESGVKTNKVERMSMLGRDIKKGKNDDKYKAREDVRLG